jgi:hypothetical protein
MTTDARFLADCAADRLDRLADDIEALAKIERPAPAAVGALATVRASRNEAAGALERLVPSLTKGSDRLPAHDEAKLIRGGQMSAGVEVACLRRWATEWRAFADA